MTSYAVQSDRYPGEYVSVRGNVEFPAVPFSRGRYPNLITVASGTSHGEAEARSRVTAELAAALAHIGRSVLVLDLGDDGDVDERLGATSDTTPMDLDRYVARTGWWTRLPMARPGVWIGGRYAESAARSDRNLRTLLRRARTEFDYIVASVSPTTPHLYRFAFNTGLFLVVDPHPGQPWSESMCSVVKDLRLSDAPELCVVLRDPQDDTAGSRAATRSLGPTGPNVAAWPSLPGGTALAEAEFAPFHDARANEFVRLAEAIEDRSGEPAPGPTLAVPVESVPSVASRRSIESATPVKAYERSMTEARSDRCQVMSCRKRPRARTGFCARHRGEGTRVARYHVDRSGLDIRWLQRCQASGCWNPSQRTHCWDHERALHPERVCRMEGCDERARMPERGGVLCAEHDEQHNPLHPFVTKRDRFLYHGAIAASGMVVVMLMLWVAVFGIRWYAADSAGCAQGAFEWTWFGPRCHVTSDELFEAGHDARAALFAVYEAEMDRGIDDLIIECAERASLIESMPRGGRFAAQDAAEACLYVGFADLEEQAEAWDEDLDVAEQAARADLYEERTGSRYPSGG